MSADHKDWEHLAIHKTLPDNNPASKVYGILPDWALREFIKEKVIGIEPMPSYLETAIEGVSIDFTLGNTIKVFRSDGNKTIDITRTSKEDIEKMMETQTYKTGEMFILKPKTFAIATTRERLTLPLDIIGRLEGRSSLARLGIVVHSTAARFDPGWDGCPVLEFSTFSDRETILYPGQTLVCAFSFERLQTPVEKGYNGKYGSNLPEVSAIVKDNKLPRAKARGIPQVEEFVSRLHPRDKSRGIIARNNK